MAGVRCGPVGCYPCIVPAVIGLGLLAKVSVSMARVASGRLDEVILLEKTRRFGVRRSHRRS